MSIARSARRRRAPFQEGRRAARPGHAL